MKSVRTDPVLATQVTPRLCRAGASRRGDVTEIHRKRSLRASVPVSRLCPLMTGSPVAGNGERGRRERGTDGGGREATRGFAATLSSVWERRIMAPMKHGRDETGQAGEGGGAAVM